MCLVQFTSTPSKPIIIEIDSDFDISCYFNHEPEISHYQFNLLFKIYHTISNWVSFKMETRTENRTQYAIRPMQTIGRKIVHVRGIL